MPKRLNELLTLAERKAIRAPIESARTLPRRAYFDDSFYEYELAHVLHRSWIAIGFSAQLAAPGDVLPLNAVGIPVLLTRASDGVARAFHNVCPYDGCEVAITPAHGCEALVTPYHGWHYQLDGKLVSAGYFDGTKDATSVDLEGLNADLVPIACTEWLGTLFVHIGNDAPSFADANRAVLEHVAPLDLSRLAIGLEESGAPLIRELHIASNWKTVYENYSPNVYHESFVHAMYRKSPHSPRVDEHGNKTYTELNDASGFLGLCYDNSIGGSFYGDSKLPPLRLKTGEPNDTNTIANMFPNWVITVLADTARMSIFLPDDPESGTQRVATFFDIDAATDPSLATERSVAARKGIIAREEDNRICESIQRARRSPAVKNQFYSPFWDGPHYTLNRILLARMEQAETE